MNAISARGVTVRLGGRAVVRDVDLDVPQAQWVGADRAERRREDDAAARARGSRPRTTGRSRCTSADGRAEPT